MQWKRISYLVRNLAELELIEWLNGWKAVKMQPNLLELLYDSRFRVIIPQQHYKPVPAKITVELDTHAPPARKHEWFPGMEPLFLRTAKQRAILSQAQLKKNSSVRTTSIADACSH